MKTETKPLGPRKLKQLEKEINGQYGKYMSGIQVSMMNLCKLSTHVTNAVINEGKTIEAAYEEAKGLFREN